MTIIADDEPSPAPPAGLRGRTARARARFGARWDGLPGNVQGALWMLGSGVFFTVMSAFIKFLGTRIPVLEILFIRQVVMFAILLPAFARNPVMALHTRYPKLHAGRIALAVISMVAGFTSIVHMPLADGVAISFSRSFFTTIFAIILLGERVGLQRWAATLVGFAGVLIMLRPTPSSIDVYALLGVTAAATVGLVLIIIRKLAQKEQLLTVMTYQSLGVGLVLMGPALYQWVTPTWQECLLLLMVGAFSAIGQSFNFRAFRVGEPSAITSMDYVRLVYAALLGLLLFSEVPTPLSLAGAAIIIGASLFSIRHESRAARKG